MQRPLLRSSVQSANERVPKARPFEDRMADCDFVAGTALPVISIIAVLRGATKDRVMERFARGSVIVGLGVDISEVGRVRAAIERHGEPFVRRVFTPTEAAYCEGHRNKYERYAGRFAAKEAAMKALGTGWRRGIRWQDIEVVREPSGQPTLELRGVAREIAGKLGVKRIFVSITHTTQQALAQVIFET